MDDTRIIDLYRQRSERAIAETDAKYGAYAAERLADSIEFSKLK